jgi:hypothetical protein
MIQSPPATISISCSTTTTVLPEANKAIELLPQLFDVGRMEAVVGSSRT